MALLNEYRYTWPDDYGEKTSGYNNPDGRVGHYLLAASAEDAAIAAQTFHNRKRRVDIQLTKKGHWCTTHKLPALFCKCKSEVG